MKDIFAFGAAIATALLVAGCLGSDTSAQDEGPRARPCPASAEGPPCGTGARIGQDYDYVLYTHCGIQTAVFNGRRWRAVRPPTLRPEKYPNETKGVMRLLSSDRAQFQTGSLVAEFTVMPANVEPPWCY